jgi:N-methylhydantoinase B
VDRDGLVATALVSQERTETEPGINGGRPGSPDSIVLRAGQSGESVVAPLVYRQSLAAGDRLAVSKGGGPGWGSPLERDPAAIRDDVRDGYISLAAAHGEYGVMLDPNTLVVDVEATAAARRLAAAEAPQ